jgi:hypothetical protein
MKFLVAAMLGALLLVAPQGRDRAALILGHHHDTTTTENHGTNGTKSPLC